MDDQAGLRERTGAQDQAGGGFDHFLPGKNSGEIEPRLTMYLMPSATVMSSLVTLSSGISTRKPEVGLGVVGMKTATTFSLVFCCTSERCSLVRKPTEY